MTGRVISGGILLFAILLVSGCNENDYPKGVQYSFQPYYFRIEKTNSQGTLELDAAQAENLNELLAKYFGTPRLPLVSSTPRYTGEAEELGPVNPEDQPVLDALSLHEETLKNGAILYRQHCLYCHGLNGDGNGPTGQFLNPKPRDFRAGLFKFRSTVKRTGDKLDTSAVTLPSRQDLAKTIKHGVPTASMPSFLLLPDEKMDALISYIMHLSLRGMTENNLARRLSVGENIGDSEIPEVIAKLMKRWKDEAASVLFPKPPNESWDSLHAAGRASNWSEGRAIYLAVGGCVQCHATDGSSSELLVADNITRRNEWGDLNLPRNLLLGTYRGGSRPIDLFYRIRLGVAGSGMPAAADFWSAEPVKPGAAPAASRPFTDEEVWKLVDYVMSMPLQRVGK